MKHITLLLALILSTKAFAIEKCELPLFFLNDAVHHLVNDELEQGRSDFSTYFDLHKLLQSECATDGYTDSMNILLTRYADNRRKFNSD